MGRMKQYLKRIFAPILYVKQGFDAIKYQYFISRKGFGAIHPTAQLGLPLYITRKSNIYLEEYTRIQTGCIILTVSGKFILKKYSAIAAKCTIITGNHVPTVGIPHSLLRNHPNTDAEQNVIIEEDVWIGSNVTLLAGSHIGRGVIIGACSLVNKKIPPYAVAVGSPAKIIAVKFNIDQILMHEKNIYPENERLSRDYLEDLFNTIYKGLRTLGKG